MRKIIRRKIIINGGKKINCLAFDVLDQAALGVCARHMEMTDRC